MDEMPRFNQMVYRLVRQIPPGKVLSYGRIAVLLGVPRGSRAVGWALHALKAPTAEEGVPWYCVLNAEGRIRTSDRMEHRAALEAEGVEFRPDGTVDMRLYLWDPSPAEVWEIVWGPEAAGHAGPRQRRTPRSSGRRLVGQPPDC
jgi:methylated-DNA-protein-cysteine methyltransferase-like protein